MSTDQYLPTPPDLHCAPSVIHEVIEISDEHEEASITSAGTSKIAPLDNIADAEESNVGEKEEELNPSTNVAKKKRFRKCNCDWLECKDFTKQLKDCCAPDDPWAKDPIHFSRTSERTLALRAAIAHYLPDTFLLLKDKRSFRLARHHWPRALYDGFHKHTKRETNYTTPLTREEMEKVAEKDGSDRMLRKCNLLGWLLQRPTIENPKDVEKYMQVPVSTPEEVSDFIRKMKSAHQEHKQAALVTTDTASVNAHQSATTARNNSTTMSNNKSHLKQNTHSIKRTRSLSTDDSEDVEEESICNKEPQPKNSPEQKLVEEDAAKANFDYSTLLDSRDAKTDPEYKIASPQVHMLSRKRKSSSLIEDSKDAEQKGVEEKEAETRDPSGEKVTEATILGADFDGSTCHDTREGVREAEENLAMHFAGLKRLHTEVENQTTTMEKAFSEYGRECERETLGLREKFESLDAEHRRLTQELEDLKATIEAETLRANKVNLIDEKKETKLKKKNARLRAKIIKLKHSKKKHKRLYKKRRLHVADAIEV